MTTSNLTLTKLRSATQSLASDAVKADSYHTYIQRAVDKLVKEFPELKTYSYDPSWQPASTRIGVLPLEAGHDRRTIQFSLSREIIEDGALWEILQLWGQMVTQVWASRPTSDMPYRVQLYRGLSVVMENINRELANERVLNEACRSIVEAIEAVDHTGIVLNDNYPFTGTVVAEYPNVGNVGVQLTLQGYRVFDMMNKTLKPVVINDVETADDLLGDNKTTLMGAGIKSILILPLIIQESLIGSIGLDVLGEKHTFTEAEVEVLSSVATQLSIGIHNAELFEEINSRIVSEALTTRVTQRLPLRSDLNTLMLTAAQELGAVVGARRARIHLNQDYMNLHYDDVINDDEL